MSWLDQTPLFVIEIGFFLVLFGAIELGYRGFSLLKPKDGRKMSGQEFLLSAMLGLLALLLGFTFSLSLNRYDTRRGLVTQEAQAIESTWLRVQLLDEPYRTDLSRGLKRYADARLTWSDATGGNLNATHEMQRQLWLAVQPLAHSGTSPIVVRQVLDPLNEAFDAQIARQSLRAARIPAEVLAALVLFASLSMVMLGYILGTHGYRQIVPTALLLLLLSLAFTVILDLDSPRNGLIVVSQQALIDVRATMH
jgi:hypothetical protein